MLASPRAAGALASPRRPGSLSWALPALVLALVLCPRASAFESEQLRLGMNAYQISSVFTAYHGCGDAVIEEGPDSMSWKAYIIGHPVMVSIRLERGLVSALEYRYQARDEAEARGLFAFLALDEEQRLGSSPSARDGGLAWLAGGQIDVLSSAEREGTHEVILRVARAP